MTRRFFAHFLIIIACLFVLKKSLDFTFGWILAEVFARGTGCEVDLKNPKLHLFPLSASVDDALIRHRSEPLDGGFRAKRISIRLHFTNLFQRELLLSDLELVGTSAQSEGTDTGFIQTFAFLFPPKDPNEPARPPDSALMRWIKGWVFHITTIRITTENAPNQLVLGYRGLNYSWDKVDVEFIEQNSDPKKPYDLTATGTNFRLRERSLPEIPLGTLQGTGEIGLGQLVLAQATLGSPEPDGALSEISGSGRIRLAEPGEYNLSLSAALGKDYLRSAAASLIPRPEDIPHRLQITGELRGSYLAPDLSGHIAAHFGPGAILPARQECGIRSIETSYRVGVETGRLFDMTIEDVVEQGEITLGFSGTQSFSARLEMALDRNKRWIESCFLTGIASESPTLYQAAVDSLADSHTNFSVAGTLKPLDLRGAIESSLSRETNEMESNLSSEFHWTSATLDVKLRERGTIPQIQALVDPVTQEPEATKTAFRRATNSNIDVELRYGFETQMLELSKASIVRYPTERLLARIGPFVSDDLYRGLLGLVGENSLLDLDLRGKTNFDTVAAVNGKLDATNIEIAALPVDRLTLDISASDKLLSINNAVAYVLGGTMRGSANYSLSDHAIGGKLTTTGVRLDQLPAWQESIPDLQTELTAAIDLSGKLDELSYSGNARFATTRGDSAETRRNSDFDVSGDSRAIRVKGNLFDAANRLELLFPLSSNDKAAFEIDMQLKEFPLHYFFPVSSPAEEDDEVEGGQSAGGLTGILRYHGPYREPLLGEGSIQISRLWLKGGGLAVEQKGDLQASIADGKLIFSNVRFLTGGRELALTGSIDHRTGWNAALSGHWQLSTFLRRVDMLEQTTGQVELDLHIAGPAGAPFIEGPVKLTDGSISFPLGETIVGVSGLEAQGTFNRQRLEISQIEGRIGGSKITGAAVIDNIVGSQPLSLESGFSFQRVAVEPIEHLTFDIDGELALRTSAESPFTLSGNVFVRSGQYENIIKLTQVLRAATRVVIGSENAASARRAGSGAFSDLAFDVRINAPGGFLLETNFAQAELRSDLHLTGTAGRPLLDGKIEALEGTFGMQSREFEVLNAEAAFFSRTSSLDPRISLIGESKVFARSGEEHHVRLTVTGTLTNPRVNFSSDSGLRREEIQSLVGIGANFEALEFLRGGRETRSFAEIINPRSDASFEERLRSLTKFETVNIDTALSPATGEFVPRLVAKRPFARRTTLDIHTDLGSRRSSAAELEYELTPYLSLIGGWRSGSLRREVDQGSGQVGAGLHYRSTFPGFRLFSPRLVGKKEDEESK